MASDEVLKDFYAAEVERLVAENARLREALASIERVPYTLDGGTEAMLDRVLSLASAALAAAAAGREGRDAE